MMCRFSGALSGSLYRAYGSTMAQWELIPFLLVYSLTLTSSSPRKSPDVDVERLSSIIATSYNCRSNMNPGMAVSIVKDGRTLLSRGYGVTSPHGDTRVTGSTRFNAASLTKAITSALLVKVMEEHGSFNLSTPVREIFGRHFRFGDDLRTEYATVEDLLSHKMAVPANSRMRFDATLTRETLVYRIRYLKSLDTFRTTFIYSNIMYGLASRIAEVLGKGRWEDLVKRHLFQPLGMERSTFTTDADLNERNTAKPYEDYNGALKPIHLDLPRYYSELVGSGAFVTTADDMAKWMNFHLYEGVNDKGERVMAKDSVHELHKPRTAMPSSTMPLFQQPDIPVTTSFDIYAMGWWRGYYRGYPILGHSGASYGYRSFVILVPDIKAGVFVSMNGDDQKYAYRGTLLNLVLDHLLGVTPWVDTTTLCTFPAPWMNVSLAQSMPVFDTSLTLKRNMSAYLGVFENPGYGRLQVRLRADVMHERRQSDWGDKDSPVLTILYGFARWDLVLMPSKSAALNNGVTSMAFPEYFYGVGKDITAWVDSSPFVFHPPPDGEYKVQEISVPGFEQRLPPVFKRVNPASSLASSGGGTFVTVLCLFVIVCVLNCWLG